MKKDRILIIFMVLLLASLLGVVMWFGVSQSVIGVGSDNIIRFNEKANNTGVVLLNIQKNTSEENLSFSRLVLKFEDARLYYTVWVKPASQVFSFKADTCNAKRSITSDSACCVYNGFNGSNLHLNPSISQEDNYGAIHCSYKEGGCSEETCYSLVRGMPNIKRFTVAGTSVAVTSSTSGFETADISGIVNAFCDVRFKVDNAGACSVPIIIVNDLSGGGVRMSYDASYVVKKPNAPDVIEKIVYVNNTVYVEKVVTVENAVEKTVYVPVENDVVSVVQEQPTNMEFIKKYGLWIAGIILVFIIIIVMLLAKAKKGGKR